MNITNNDLPIGKGGVKFSPMHLTDSKVNTDILKQCGNQIKPALMEGVAQPVLDLRKNPTGWFTRELSGDAGWCQADRLVLYKLNPLVAYIVSSDRGMMAINMYAGAHAIDNRVIEAPDNTEYVDYAEMKPKSVA
jgi:hypothetical protein